MSIRLASHSNEVWIAALKGGSEKDSELLTELSRYLRRVLGSTLAKRNLADDAIDDLVQEAMFQLVRSLHTFRGDSAFPTWAAAVATRVAFTELRRRAAHESKHAAFCRAEADALAQGTPVDVPGGESTLEHAIAALHSAIDAELTDRQRVATLALLRGVPTIEIAEQLDSNTNAVYKLVHDARLRLRDALQRRGVTADVLNDLSSDGSRR